MPQPEQTFGFLAEKAPQRNALRRNLDWLISWYAFAVPDIGRSALVERSLEWLEENWPEDTAATDSVLVWGDSRVGNVLYDGFKPTAVLDWEMTTIGDPLFDLAVSLSYWVEPGDDEFFQMFRRQPTTTPGIP